jgi:hypothetical protein
MVGLYFVVAFFAGQGIAMGEVLKSELDVKVGFVLREVHAQLRILRDEQFIL